MPAPSTSLATLRPDLAGSFLELDLMMNAMDMAGQRVLPILNVANASGTFGYIPIEQLMKARQTARAPKAGYSRGDFTFTTDTFATVEYGAEELIDDNEKNLYSDFFDAELIAAHRAVHALMSGFENLVSNLVFNTTTWTGAALTTAIAGGQEWSNYTAAKPIDAVAAASNAVYNGTGIWPNALVINRRVFRNLRNCAQIVDRLTASGAGIMATPGSVGPQQLAEVFDLRYVIVAGGTKDSADEGAAASLGPIWNDEYAMVCRVAESDDLREPCIGRTFHWSEDGSMPAGMVETYREENRRAQVVRARHQVQPKILYKELGHLLTNVT